MKKVILLALCAASISAFALPTYEPFIEYSNLVSASPTNTIDLCTAGLIAPGGEAWTSLNFNATAGTNVPGIDVLVTNDISSLFTSSALSALLPAAFPGFPAAGGSIQTYAINPAQPLAPGATVPGTNPNIVGNSAVLNFAQDFTRPASGTKTLFISYLFIDDQQGQTGNGNNGRYLGFLEATNLVEGAGTSGFYKTWASLFNTYGATRYVAEAVRLPGALAVGPSDSASGPSPNPLSTLTTPYNTPSFVVGEVILVSTNASAAGTKDTNILWLNPPLNSFGGANAATTQLSAYSMGTVVSDLGGLVLIDRVGSGAAGGIGTNSIANLMLGSTWSYVTGGPEFTNQPGTVASNYGSTVTLSAAATAATQSVTYQWQVVSNGVAVNLSNGGHGTGSATVSGATTATLTLSGISLADLGSYQVVATASGTGFSLTSSAGTVSSDPLITAQPQNAAVPPGGIAVFNIGASTQFGSLTYQWRLNGAPLANSTLSDGSAIQGATTSSLTVSNFQLDENGAVITCAVTNGVPDGEISAAAILSLLVDPAVTNQPTSLTVNYGATATFTAMAETTSHAPLTYAWYDGSTMLVNGLQAGGSTVSGASGTSAGNTLTSTLTLASVSYLDDGNYTLSVTNSVNATATSANATLTVNDPFLSNQPPAIVEVAAGGAATVAITGGGTGATYQWYGNGGPLNNSGDFSGVTTPTLTISPAQAPDAGTYYITITGTHGSVVSSNVTVYVDTAVTGVSLSPAKLTQQVGTHLAFAGSFTGGSGGLVNLQWQFNGTNLSDGKRADGSTVLGSGTTTLVLSNIQVADSGHYTLMTSNATGTNVASNTLTVSAALLPLSPSTLEVIRVGEGSEPLSGATGNTMYLDQFTTNGSYVSTIMVPDNGPPAVLVAGAGTDGPFEGYLTLSSNQQFLNFAGYCWNYPYTGGSDVTVGGAADVRGIGAINALGAYVLAYTNYGLYSGGGHFIRAAYSTDGLTNFWTTGAAGSGAIKYVNAGPAGASYTTVTPGQGIPALSTSVGGSQVLGLAGSNLVFSDDGEVNISGLDAFPGAPQANVATANIVYTGSPADFAFSPDLNTVYIADNGPAISGGTGYGGGIQRWDLVGGAYTYSYNLEDTTGAGTNGIRGMTAVFPTNSTGWGQGIYGAVIYATTSETAANRLIRFADTSGVSSAPPTLLATAGTNQFLRGVRFGPLAQPISFVSAPQSLTTCGNENVTFTAVASGNPTLGFQWQSNGVSIGGFTQTNLGANVQSTLTLTNVLVSSSGIYTAIVTNGVQSNSAQASLTVISPSGAPTLISDVQTTNIVQPVGEPVVLSVVACGAPASYQWQLNGTNLANNGHVSGAQTSTLTIANTQLSDSGNYQLVLTNASGTNYSSTVSLTVTLIGFNNGADWAVNGGATITNGVLTLSDGGLSEARSSYLNERVDILAFLASWTYQDVGAGAADGIVFVVQNSAAGTAALGGTGGNLGYLGVTNSVGLEFNIYTPNTVGIGLGTNGAGTGAGPFAPTTPVNLASGDPIGVALHYLNGNATLTLTDAVAAVSFTTNFAVNVPGLVGGNTAYVGFSGGTGGATSTQTVSNFFFTTLPVVAVQNAAGNTLILTWPAGAPGFTLQQTSSLSNPVWTTLTNIPTVVNGQNQVTLTPSGNTEFYRLIIQ